MGAECREAWQAWLRGFQPGGGWHCHLLSGETPEKDWTGEKEKCKLYFWVGWFWWPVRQTSRSVSIHLVWMSWGSEASGMKIESWRWSACGYWLKLCEWLLPGPYREACRGGEGLSAQRKLAPKSAPRSWQCLEPIRDGAESRRGCFEKHSGGEIETSLQE